MRAEFSREWSLNEAPPPSSPSRGRRDVGGSSGRRKKWQEMCWTQVSRCSAEVQTVGQVLHASKGFDDLAAWKYPEGLQGRFLRPLPSEERTHVKI